MKKVTNLKSYLLRVVLNQETGLLSFLVKVLLTFLEVIYFFLLNVRKFFNKSHSLPIPVISIGNILAGGTGKTPTVIWLTKFLKKEGFNPAILTRGYHGESQNQGIIFKYNDLKSFSAKKVGDEPFLLAKELPETIIVVGKKRYLNGIKALSNHPEIDLFIMDDGFQHWSLKRNLDIVMIDAEHPFGNGHLFPRGLLREPISSLKRADVALLRSDKIEQMKFTNLSAQILKINPKIQVTAIHEENLNLIPLPGLLNLQTQNTLDFLPGRKVSAITGIGNPRQFLASLEKLGAEVGYFKAYPDHYRWDESEIIELIKVLTENGFRELIVTAKDSVKLETFAEHFICQQLSCFILSLDFNITDQAVLQRIISSVSFEHKNLS